MVEYRTDRSRAWRALLIGAVAGAGTVALLFLALFVRDEGMGALRYLPFALFIFVCAFAGWGIGLLALAVPAWLLLHRLKQRSLPLALLLGVAGAFLAQLALDATGLHAVNFAVHEMFSPDTDMQYDAWSRYRAALAMGAVGVMVALIVWHRAYRAHHCESADAG